MSLLFNFLLSNLIEIIVLLGTTKILYKKNKYVYKNKNVNIRDNCRVSVALN